VSEKTMTKLQQAVEAHVADLAGERVGASYVLCWEETRLSDGACEVSYSAGDAVSPAHAVGIMTMGLTAMETDLGEGE
jgi:hypothetical protein